MRKLFCILMLLIAVSGAAQDTSKLSTDRPDQTDGASLLNKKEFQFETEVYYNTFKEGRAAIISSSLFRYGLHKSVELRLLVEDGRERDKFIDETVQGLAPLALSTKIAILKDHPVLPDVVFITYLKMPLTRHTSDDVYWSPLFMLAFEKEGNKFTFATNAGIRQEAFGKGWLWQASADVKYELNKHIELYTEYFAQYQKQENPNHNIDGGLLFYINNNWMVHAAYGSTIFVKESNHFVNTGLSFRIR
jgi:hypothetical protein